MRAIGADKRPSDVFMLFASLLILSGITVHIYSGSFVVEAGCFIFNVFRVLLGGVRQLVSSKEVGEWAHVSKSVRLPPF